MRQALRRCVTPADEGRIMNQRVNPPQIRRDRGRDASARSRGRRVGGRSLALPALPGEMDRTTPASSANSDRIAAATKITGIQSLQAEVSRQKKASHRKRLKWFRKVSLASRSVQECSFFYRQSALGSKRCPLPTTYLPTASLQAACLSISVTSSSTSLPISEGSSPSAITLISGSVPDGRTSNRPPFWSSRDFASAIA